MSYYIVRNGQQYGPYDAQALDVYVGQGRMLKQDLAIDAGTGAETTVRNVLQHAGLKGKIQRGGSVRAQISAFGRELLLPKASFQWQTFRNDQKLLLISLIGLAPAFLIRFTPSSGLTFYAIALYFSMIWGMFFHSVFKTPQVKLRPTIVVFFLVQIVIFLVVDVLNLTAINPFYSLLESGNFFLRLIGFTAGVGVLEEVLKALPVAYLCFRATKGPLVPQTAVFYGLISGIGFGVFEGVRYQLTVNKELDYGSSFFMNIARLTSLPFLHATWAGISAYFIALAVLYPRNRNALLVLAIAIPAVLHGLYDVLGWSVPGLLVSYFGVALLVVYLQQAKAFVGKMLP
jgi:RsiW-degrading membrane proteinase PrsW (M82 family)